MQNRPEKLSHFDACVADFSAHARSEYQAGCHVAVNDTACLAALADQISHSLHTWNPLLSSLEVSRSRPLHADRDMTLILEGLFDDLLEPYAWRLLAAAVDLCDDPDA